MTGKDYLNGFIFGLLAAILTVVDLCLTVFFADSLLIFRLALIALPLIINIVFFSCKNYTEWLYRKAILWLLFGVLVIIALNVFSALAATAQVGIAFLFKQGYFDSAMIAEVKNVLRHVVYCALFDFAGIVISIVIVAVRKNMAYKKSQAALQQRKLSLKRKSKIRITK